MKITFGFFLLAVAALGALGAPPASTPPTPPPPPDGTVVEARELVKGATPLLRKAGQTAIEVTAPRWADGREVEPRAGLVEAVAAALAADGFTVGAGAKAQFLLKLEPTTDGKTDQPAVRLCGAVRLNGQERDVGFRVLMGEEALARLYAPRQLVLDPRIPERDRVPYLTGARKPPPAAQPKVGMEMLIRDPDGTFRARAPVGGKITVKELQTYHLRFFNNERDVDFGVLLTIDGSRWDEYCDLDEATAPKGRMVLVKAGTEVFVRGWFAADNKSLAFDLLALPSFAAASKSEVGVITTQWHPVWEKGKAPPAGEERAVSHRSVIGTAAVREQVDSFVAVEREAGRMRVCLSLRYGR